jgi:hypothetical protein
MLSLLPAQVSAAGARVLVLVQARVLVQEALFVSVLMTMTLTRCSADWRKALLPLRLPLRTLMAVVVETAADPL